MSNYNKCNKGKKRKELFLVIKKNLLVLIKLIAKIKVLKVMEEIVYIALFCQRRTERFLKPPQIEHISSCRFTEQSNFPSVIETKT